MGLDIHYYSKIKEIESTEDYTIKSNNEHFEYHLGSLKNDQCYETTKDSKHGSFRAGSYSGYNFWRNQLSIMAGYPGVNYVWDRFDTTKEMKPFYELINFSDCEGIIGSEISKKLYQDFVDFDEKAKNWEKHHLNFYNIYTKFREAFKVALDQGAVCFG